MVFNTTLNNISVISWLVRFIGGGNQRPVASHWQTLSHNVISSTAGFELTTVVVIGIKSNYHTITAMTTQDCVGNTV